MLSGPEALFDARESIAFSNSDVTMSAKRELSKSGDVSTYGCWCGRSASPSQDGVPSFSKKSAHPLCMLSLWYSAPSKASLSVGAGWVLLWFLRRWKSFSELEACMSRFLKKSNFCFRAVLRSSFRNSLLHFCIGIWPGVKWICRLASPLPVVPCILGMAMSCIQGGIPIGISVLMVLFGWYCFLAGR